MNKNAVISARIDAELKTGAEEVFDSLGLTRSQAITLFYRQVQLQNGLPFRVQIPNRETRDALEDARKRQHLTSRENSEELFEDLGI